MKEKKLFYTDQGTGKVCVLLHGFMENKETWSTVIDALGHQNRFIAIDLPGHGQRGTLHHDATMVDYAHAVKSTLDEIGIGEVQVIGHSMGGYVGLAFAKAFPSQTKGLLLLNSTPIADTHERVENRKHGIAVAKKNYTAIVRMSIANLFTETYRKEHGSKIEEAQQEALKTPVAGYIAAQKAMMVRPDLTEFWKTSTLKKMIVLGSEDPLIDAEVMKKRFPNIDIQVISGGHMSLLENPTGVQQGIKEFLGSMGS